MSRTRHWFIRGPARAGFTLIELLVLLAIVGTLIGLLVPAVLCVRATAQRTQCLNNLHEVGMLTQIYVNDHGSYPPAWTNSTCRWMDLLKPYVDKQCAVYRCPSDPKQITCTYDPTITLSYGINCFNFGGDQYCFWYQVASWDVKDPRMVILYADCTPGQYWCGGGSTFRDPVSGVDYRHIGGTFNAVYCDAHAESKMTTTKTDWNAAQ